MARTLELEPVAKATTGHAIVDSSYPSHDLMSRVAVLIGLKKKKAEQKRGRENTNKKKETAVGESDSTPNRTGL